MTPESKGSRLADRPPFPRSPRVLRAVGFDDAPFQRRRGARVHVAGVVCAGVRFEGLVWGSVSKDGWDATEEIGRLLVGGKFLPQIHLVLLDGIAFGGFNVVDLPALALLLGKPCAAIMRRRPDLDSVERAMRELPRAESRLAILRRAGPVHCRGRFVFQVRGADPDATADALARLTDTGRVPEALRLAHLVGAAVVSGVSGRRA